MRGIFWGAILAAALTACAPKSVYLTGGQGSSATIDISAATGVAKLVITGPFTYCEEREGRKALDAEPTGKLCPALREK